jgi:hypothetical protein
VKRGSVPLSRIPPLSGTLEREIPAGVYPDESRDGNDMVLISREAVQKVLPTRWVSSRVVANRRFLKLNQVEMTFRPTFWTASIISLVLASTPFVETPVQFFGIPYNGTRQRCLTIAGGTGLLEPNPSGVLLPPKPSTLVDG